MQQEYEYEVGDSSCSEEAEQDEVAQQMLMEEQFAAYENQLQMHEQFSNLPPQEF